MVLIVSTIIFSIVIASLTLTQSILLSGYVFWVVFIFIAITGYVQGKLMQYISMFFVVTICGYVCVQVFISQYNKHVLVPAQAVIHINNAWFQSILQTGSIVEQQTHNRYVWETSDGIPFFLYTEKDYNPWDVILLDARAQLTSTWSLSLFVQHKQKQKRVSWLLQSYEFDFQQRQIMKWVAGSLYENNSIILWDTNPNRISKLKHNVQLNIQKIFGQSFISGLLWWMLIWDRSMMNDEQYTLFVDSWLVHIIAVSWWNIVMLVLFLHILLFWVPFYLRIGIIIPCIIFYALICWLDASVLRAVIMWSLSLLALFRWKQTMIWRSLFIAYIVMLVVNPFFLIYDIGFIFSFAAVVGIVYMTQWTQNIRFEHSYRWRVANHILHDYVFPSIGASMAIVPFLLFFTGSFNIVSIVANIFVVPLIPIVMLIWILAIILPYGIIWSILSWIVSICVDYIHQIAILTQKYGIYIMSQWYLFIYMLLLIVILFFIVDRLSSKKNAM